MGYLEQMKQHNDINLVDSITCSVWHQRRRIILWHSKFITKLRIGFWEWWSSWRHLCVKVTLNQWTISGQPVDNSYHMFIATRSFVTMIVLQLPWCSSCVITILQWSLVYSITDTHIHLKAQTSQLGMSFDFSTIFVESSNQNTASPNSLMPGTERKALLQPWQIHVSTSERNKIQLSSSLYM
jgi:hypothetical protein